MLTIAINDRIQTSVSDYWSALWSTLFPKETVNLFSYIIIIHLVNCCLLPFRHISHLLRSPSWSFLSFLFFFYLHQRRTQFSRSSKNVQQKAGGFASPQTWAGIHTLGWGNKNRYTLRWILTCHTFFHS